MSIEKIPSVLLSQSVCPSDRGKPEVGQDGVRCVTSIIHLGLVGRHRPEKEDGGGRRKEEGGREERSLGDEVVAALHCTLLHFLLKFSCIGNGRFMKKCSVKTALL